MLWNLHNGKRRKREKAGEKMCVWLAKYPVTIRRRNKFYNCQVKWIGIETFSRLYLESLEKTFHRKHLVETTFECYWFVYSTVCVVALADFVCYLSISVCNVKSYKKQRSRKEVIKIKQGASRVCNALLAHKKNVIKFSCWKLKAIASTSCTNQIQFWVKSGFIHCRWIDYSPFVKHCSSNLKCFTWCFVIVVDGDFVGCVFTCACACAWLWLICLWRCRYWSTPNARKRERNAIWMWSALSAGLAAGKPLYQTNAVKIEG